MKNSRGFTLVEMLGVLIILIMVFMIVFPSLTKMIKDTNDEIDAATVSVIEGATADFLAEKSDVYPKGDDYTYCIALSQLIDNANLTEKQIATLPDTAMIVKTTFVDRKPVYVLTKTCTTVAVDVDFTLIGESNMSFQVGVGGQYVEPGATALNKAGQTVSYTTTITNSKKETVAYIDTTKVDIYAVKYSANIDGKDYLIERIVKVVDTTAPTITVNPISETIAITNDTYNVLSGVTASDNSGDIPTIKASTNLSLGQAGTYTVTYTATDSSGNKKTAKRTVIISNSSLVNITLVGNKTIDSDSNYIDQGATAVDSQNNDLTNELTTTIIKNGVIVPNTKNIGTYHFTYSIVKDNVVYSESRTVNITHFANGTAVYFNPDTGTNCTAGEAVSIPGTKTGCMKWYIFNDSAASTNINLILDHNTTAQVEWYSSRSNVAGPTTLLTQLASDTSSWAGVPTRTDSYTVNNGTATYTINYSTYKARLITAGDIATITGNTGFNEATTIWSSWFYFDTNTQTPTATSPGTSKYAWLYDYTDVCTGSGCNIADSSTSGYWSATAVSGDSINTWTIYKLGLMGNDFVDHAIYYGVRPVITISKSIMG